jgi:L-rhamnose isomerase
MAFAISPDFIAKENRTLEAALAEDYAVLGRQLKRRGIDIEKIVDKASGFAVAVPTWGVGTGGTRFARFPGPGEPRDPVNWPAWSQLLPHLLATDPAQTDSPELRQLAFSP